MLAIWKIINVHSRSHWLLPKSKQYVLAVIFNVKSLDGSHGKLTNLITERYFDDRLLILKWCSVRESLIADEIKYRDGWLFLIDGNVQFLTNLASAWNPAFSDETHCRNDWFFSPFWHYITVHYCIKIANAHIFLHVTYIV